VFVLVIRRRSLARGGRHGSPYRALKVAVFHTKLWSCSQRGSPRIRTREVSFEWQCSSSPVMLYTAIISELRDDVELQGRVSQ
jgi:hypothetical protein